MPSSGPYFIRSFSATEIVFAKNPYYPSPVGYDEIKFVQMTDHDAFNARVSGKVDIIFPATLPPTDTRRALVASSQVYRTFGTTTFLSFRPTASDGWLTNPSFRRRLSELLRTIPDCGPHCQGLEKSSSILMGDGLGRLPAPAKVKENIASQTPTLRLAAVDNARSRHIVEFLEDSGVTLKTHWVAQFNGLYTQDALNTDAMIG